MLQYRQPVRSTAPGAWLLVLTGVLAAVCPAAAGAAQEASPPPAPASSLLPESVPAANVPPTALAIAQAERAFAATSVAKGVRAAFYDWFAEDGIGYGPAPQNQREAIRKRPPQTARPPVTLDWEPIFVDAASSGDLGISTGPTLFTDQGPDPQPPGYGFYFSVWRRQADGNWRVENDFGTQTPAVDATRLSLATAPTPAVPPAQLAGVEAAKAALLARDGELATAIAAKGYAAGLAAALGPAARLHRDGMLPAVGAPAITTWLASHDTRPTARPMAGGISLGEDLGYVYGSWETAGEPAAKGYYLRVWKRFAEGWKVVADLISVVPPAASEG